MTWDTFKAPFETFVNWIVGFFDATSAKQSMKRMTMFMAAFTLCRGTIIICKAIAHQIYQGQEVGQNSVYALGALAVPVAALAGVAYIFRKDGPQASTAPSTSTEQP